MRLPQSMQTQSNPPSTSAPMNAMGAMGGSGATPGATAWSAAAARMPGLLERIKNIVLSPKSEWPRIALEPTAAAQLYTGYVMPLAAFAALMSLVRMSLIGVALPFGGVIRTPIGSGLAYALLAFGFGLLGLFLMGLLINALAPMFSGTRDQRQALKVAAYSCTPAYLAALLALSPILPTLLQLIAGCYGIYVLYLGLPVLMRAPPEKAFGYAASVVICSIVLAILVGIVSAATGFVGHPTAGDRAAARDQGAALSNLAKAGEQSQRAGAQTQQSMKDAGEPAP